MHPPIKKKILIADPSTHIQKMIQESSLNQQYDLFFVQDGIEFKRELRTLSPDLIICELLLPRHHGIELLKWMKTHEDLKNIGFIIMTYELIEQNHKAAYQAGANFFLEKPFSVSLLKEKIEKYFEGTLKKVDFSGNLSIDYAIDSYYDPKYDATKNYLKFWGTRGSSSVSGGEYAKFGGMTSCLEIKYGKDLVIIDAGTGIRPLGEELIEQDISHLHLIISHTHQDHIIGFPFFIPLYSESTTLNIYSPIGFERDTKELFSEMLDYSFFPVRLDQMHAKMKFHSIGDGDSFHIGSIKIDCCYTYHPGSTLGFKISTPKQKIGYITDNEFLVGFHGHPNEIDIHHPALANHLRLVEFLSDCDIIIHEAQYFTKEYLKRVGWGHSSMVNACVLFKLIKCPIWIVCHHDPRHTDSDLNYKAELNRKILRESDIFVHVRYAYDGMIVPLD